LKGKKGRGGTLRYIAGEKGKKIRGGKTSEGSHAGLFPVLQKREGKGVPPQTLFLQRKRKMGDESSMKKKRKEREQKPHTRHLSCYRKERGKMAVHIIWTRRKRKMFLEGEKRRRVGRGKDPGLAGLCGRKKGKKESDHLCVRK